MGRCGDVWMSYDEPSENETRVDRRYCSPACRQRAYRMRRHNLPPAVGS